MNAKGKSLNVNANTKIVYFGLGTESKHLFDYFALKGYQNYGFFSDKENLLVTGTLDAGLALLKSDAIFNQVICCSKKTPLNVINQLIQYCHSNKVKLYLIPDENGSYVKNYNPIYINGVIVFELAIKPLSKKINLFLKRLFDFVFSLLVVVFILSWLFPLLAILIKLESRGPVLFVQKRNGYQNQGFNCFKFRTMFLNAQSDLQQAKAGDVRISKIGKFLRKTSIDEFPQFLNVLLGDMSVVGPRPHMLKHNEMYAELIDNYNQRTFVKPGITGLAQVLGYRGETESDLFLMKIRVRMDIFYINNWSYLLDFKIVMKTIFNVFIPNKNAF
jgi:putative colanic acid biosynthesis UDP-glucose lipid carrier transferase